MTHVLDEHARKVADAVLHEEERKRRHLVVALSGAHAYGFPSPDSDLDLKAIHIAPTQALLGLAETPTTSDRAEVIDGVEIDYTSNELGAALRGLLKGNGNYLERVLGTHQLIVASELAELVPLAKAALSKRYYGHYRGFARQQEAELAKAAAPTAKKVLYVLRTALTGARLLTTGELHVDLNDNLDEYDYGDARELIEKKKAGERTVLDEASLRHWQARVQRAFTWLDEALAKSRLPEESPNAVELEAWLIDVRMRALKESARSSARRSR
jgi:predicted nucleotidyltransferase